MQKISMQKLIETIAQYDTPTICNAIEVAQGERGFNQYTKSTLFSSTEHRPGKVAESRMVGIAKTAQIAAREPTRMLSEDVRSLRMDYYRYMSEPNSFGVPSLVVIEDYDYPRAVGAFWGEVNTAIHKAFGLVGTLTNGVMRDLDEVVEGYPVLAGSIGPSHAFVRVEKIDCPVSLFELEIRPNDLVHADKHGAVVVPPSVYDDLPQAIEKLLANEQIVLAPTREPDFNFEKFEKSWEAFEKART